MTGAPAHAELRDLLPAAALEILDQLDAQRVLFHVRACVGCSRLLDDYRDLTARIGLLLPLREMSPTRAAALRARLLARAQADRRPSLTLPSPTGVLPIARPAAYLAERWTGWLVAAALAGVTLIHHGIHRPLDHGWLAAGILAILLAVVGRYAQRQRGRIATLQQELSSGRTERDASPTSLQTG